MPSSGNYKSLYKKYQGNEKDELLLFPGPFLTVLFLYMITNQVKITLIKNVEMHSKMHSVLFPAAAPPIISSKWE